MRFSEGGNVQEKGHKYYLQVCPYVAYCNMVCVSIYGSRQRRLMIIIVKTICGSWNILHDCLINGTQLTYPARLSYLLLVEVFPFYFLAVLGMQLIIHLVLYYQHSYEKQVLVLLVKALAVLQTVGMLMQVFLVSGILIPSETTRDAIPEISCWNVRHLDRGIRGFD